MSAETLGKRALYDSRVQRALLASSCPRQERDFWKSARRDAGVGERSPASEVS
jgi:hypothetical protein